MLTVLCPGQGAQKVGMGKELFDSCSKAKDIFESADEILGKIDGLYLSEHCFLGPEEMLTRTDISQPAIFVTSYAAFHSLKSNDKNFKVESAAGLSLGEYTALALAGVFTFEDAVRLVAKRGELMQKASSLKTGSMSACMGKEEDVVSLINEVKSSVDKDTVLGIANYNSETQFVISGDKEACISAEILSEKFNVKLKALSVSGAFHSDHMKEASQGLSLYLKDLPIQLPKFEVWSNVTASVHENNIESIRNRLVEQLTQPVRWTELVKHMAKDCSRSYYELPPSGVLKGLMRRINKQIKVEILNA